MRLLPWICLFAVQASWAAAASGAQLAATCAACHALEGGVAIPPLVGLDADRLTQTMLAYRSGERPSHLMRAVSRALSDQEIVTVSRYLAAPGNPP